MDGERLARIEERHINNSRLMNDFIVEQRKINEMVQNTFTEVEKIKSNTKLGWTLLCAFAGVSAALSTGIAWIVTHIKLKMMGF